MAAIPSAQDASESSKNSNIYLYFGSLTFLITLANPAGGLLDISSTFMLKDLLHMGPDAIALFRVVTAIPVYFAFLFGLTRDSWNPFGLRDRGYFILFGPLTAAVFLWMCFGQFNVTTMFVGVFASTFCFRFCNSAYQGLMSLVGQEKLMSGRITTVWMVVSFLPAAAAAYGGGWVTEHLKPSQTFTLLALLCLGIGLTGLWKPRSVFKGVYERPQARGTTFFRDVARLLKHKAIYPAVLICFLWNFAPGSATPLAFYLTNTLHASDQSYANYQAIFNLAFIPTFLLYGPLCKRIPLKKLLFWGTVVAVPQMIPLAFIHSAVAAEWLAAPIGLMGGVATAAYYDLAIRSCPPGLQGTLMMLVDGVFMLSGRLSDPLGTRIYKASPEHGFQYCVIAITIVYALILPVLLWVPKHITATRDGEENPELMAEIEKEIA